MFKKDVGDIERRIGSGFLWWGDDRNGDGKRECEMNEKDVEKVFERVVKVKKGEGVWGIQVCKEEVVDMSEEGFVWEMEGGFEKVGLV